MNICIIFMLKRFVKRFLSKIAIYLSDLNYCTVINRDRMREKAHYGKLVERIDHGVMRFKIVRFARKHTQYRLNAEAALEPARFIAVRAVGDAFIELPVCCNRHYVVPNIGRQLRKKPKIEAGVIGKNALYTV